MKRVFGLLWDQKLLFILSIVGTIAQVALTIYLPILIGLAIDQTISVNQVDFDALKNVLFQIGVVIALNVFLQWINPLMYNQMTYKAVGYLREKTMEQVHKLPLSYLDQQSTGDLVSRISTDAEQLADGIIMIINQLFAGVLTIFITIFTMGQIDLFMMVIVVSLTPISLFFARFIAKRSYRYFQKQTQYRGLHTQLIEEYVQQNEVVRLFNYQSEVIEQFDPLNHQYAEYSQKAIFYSSTINPTTRFINALIYAALTFFGAIRIMQGTFTVGALTTFLNYANQYTKPFNEISNVLAELQSAIACAERLYELIDREPESETGHRILRVEDVEGKVAFNRAYFSYHPDQKLIENLTLSVPSGQKVAIVGPTGAGKSTLINLLMRFYDLNQGQILLDNQPITDYTRESVRAQFGMVLQETWLKTATIHDNIAFGHPQATREQVIHAAQAARADHFIQQLPDGYDTFLADAGASLSQGQRQLLTIARIFVEVPHLLILDEATSSIDTRTEILIQEAFQTLMEGRTSFIIAHRLSTIQQSDIILVMNNGQIVEQGNHDSLMRMKGLYYDMQTSTIPAND
ncbi:ABC transporter ATP-binding protein/permease [Fundicoccus culcitae]|uniref:ABC transporter ATP-binding protein/permease n=2 Tax=Fundicoccus culcitae TaxID=2969821 RepID=A0ABY5P9V1_9LACT|nr:ABC transporter ATP-binding protein [Fundicoccus culcitae]UUX35528.1 ABC transporter ATP-binding protein/permease [Fundicoccus culcitae]